MPSDGFWQVALPYVRQTPAAGPAIAMSSPSPRGHLGDVRGSPGRWRTVPMRQATRNMPFRRDALCAPAARLLVGPGAARRVAKVGSLHAVRIGAPRWAGVASTASHVGCHLGHDDVCDCLSLLAGHGLHYAAGGLASFICAASVEGLGRAEVSEVTEHAWRTGQALVLTTSSKPHEARACPGTVRTCAATPRDSFHLLLGCLSALTRRAGAHCAHMQACLLCFSHGRLLLFSWHLRENVRGSVR